MLFRSASSSQIAREKLDTEELVNFTYQPSPWDELVKRFGASMGRGFATLLTEQTLSLR